MLTLAEKIEISKKCCLKIKDYIAEKNRAFYFKMKKLSTRFLVILLTFFVGIFAVAGCFYYQESQRVQILIPNSRLDSLLSKEINRATNLGGLTELRKTSLSTGDIEVRVWRGFGLSPLEGVILKRTDGIWSGLHIKTNRYNESEKAKVKRLNSPKSGWQSFWNKLIDKEILTLPQLPENECDITAWTDGTGYAVEISQNKTYRNYYYPSRGRCREAKQLSNQTEIL